MNDTYNTILNSCQSSLVFTHVTVIHGQGDSFFRIQVGSGKCLQDQHRANSRVGTCVLTEPLIWVWDLHFMEKQ